jgi:uncharacterized membrane protein YbaN (DUF454 family)
MIYAWLVQSLIFKIDCVTEDNNVQLPKPIFRPIPLIYKIGFSVLIAVFLVIGLIGLILPIIPGILFLVLAVFLMTRVSRRAATYAHSQAWYHRHMGQLNATRHLPAGDRLKFGFLIAARGTINAIKRLFNILIKGC